MGKFNFTDEKDFQEVKQKAEAFYKTIGKVYCPFFKEEIVFNAKGLKHLKFKGNWQARPRKDQYSRLKLLDLVPEVLKQSYTLQGILKIKKFEDQKTNNRWEKVFKEVTYYEFVAVLKNVRIKVVIKQVLTEEKYFLSVIPFWKIDKKTNKRILCSENPEQD